MGFRHIQGINEIIAENKGEKLENLQISFSNPEHSGTFDIKFEYDEGEIMIQRITTTRVVRPEDCTKNVALMVVLGESIMDAVRHTLSIFKDDFKELSM